MAKTQKQQKAPPPSGKGKKPDRADKAAQGQPGDDSQPDDGTSSLGKIVVRNEFYRDGYRTLLKIAILEALVIVGLIFVMLYVIHVHQPENRYFATTEDGRLMPMVPLSEPNLSTPALMSWTAQAATEVLTFGFNDYRLRLQESSRHFTREGWETFNQSLQQSKLLERVEENTQVLTSAPSGAPVVIAEGLRNGRYQWQVQMPIVLTLQAGRRSEKQNLLVTMVIVRVPRLESSNGVGIQQWVSFSN